MALPDDDPELKDLVTQTLEQNGLLKNIRAQLRAGVFLALEESENREHLTLENQPFKEFIEKPEGAVITYLVREFLEYFGFDYTLSVFDPEAGLGKEFIYPGREKLASQVGLEDVGDNKPLLGHILLNFENTLVEDSIVQENKTYIFDNSDNNDSTRSDQKDSFENKSSSLKTSTFPENKTINKENNSTSAFKQKIVGSSLLSLETSIEDENNSITTINKPIQDKKNTDENSLIPSAETSQIKNHHKEDERKKENSITSLSNLPPLINKNSIENIGQLKTMVELSLDSTSEAQYEEDFEENDNTPKESEKQDSESEIQEEIEYVDDLLSLSAAVDDLTVSATVSTGATGPRADYSESI